MERYTSGGPVLTQTEPGPTRWLPPSLIDFKAIPSAAHLADPLNTCQGNAQSALVRGHGVTSQRRNFRLWGSEVGFESYTADMLRPIQAALVYLYWFWLQTGLRHRRVSIWTGPGIPAGPGTGS